jgi:hypothetical protein
MSDKNPDAKILELRRLADEDEKKFMQKRLTSEHVNAMALLPIDQIFGVLLKMVEVIDEHTAKMQLKGTLPETRARFDQFYTSCEKTNNSNDGIQAFMQIQNYVQKVKQQYDRNPVHMNERLKMGTSHAMQLALFMDNVSNDMCTMMKNTPQTTDKQYCTMIQEQLTAYTTITFEHVEGMQRRREATFNQLKAAGIDLPVFRCGQATILLGLHPLHCSCCEVKTASLSPFGVRG